MTVRSIGIFVIILTICQSRRAAGYPKEPESMESSSEEGYQPHPFAFDYQNRRHYGDKLSQAKSTKRVRIHHPEVTTSIRPEPATLASILPEDTSPDAGYVEKIVNYDFAVNDYNGNEQSKREHIENDRITGQYRSRLPDGSFQIVNYQAGPEGYVADVQTVTYAPAVFTSEATTRYEITAPSTGDTQVHQSATFPTRDTEVHQSTISSAGDTQVHQTTASSSGDTQVHEPPTSTRRPTGPSPVRPRNRQPMNRQPPKIGHRRPMARRFRPRMLHRVGRSGSY